MKGCSPRPPITSSLSQDQLATHTHTIDEVDELGQTLRSQVIPIGTHPTTVFHHSIRRRPHRIGKKDERPTHPAIPHPSEHPQLERLHHQRRHTDPPRHSIRKQFIERQPERREVLRMLQLGHHPHPTTHTKALRIEQLHQVHQPQNRLDPIERRIGYTKRRQPLSRPQHGQLSPGEILREPPRALHTVDDLRRATTRKLDTRCHIRRARQLVLVPHDQNAITRHHKVGLNGIRPQLDRKQERTPSVLGTVSASTPMRDNERTTYGSERHRARLTGPRLVLFRS